MCAEVETVQEKVTKFQVERCTHLQEHSQDGDAQDQSKSSQVRTLVRPLTHEKGQLGLI